MAKFASTYPGQLVLPGGVVIEPLAAVVDLSDEHLRNAAVAEWVEKGWLVSEEEQNAQSQARAETKLAVAQAALKEAEDGAAASASNRSTDGGAGAASGVSSEAVTAEDVQKMDREALAAFLTAEEVAFDGRSGADALRELALNTIAVNDE